MKTIKEEWESFREAVIHKDASETQLRDMKDTFYSGVMVGFNSMITSVEENSSEEIAETKIIALTKEAHDYLSRVHCD